MAKVRVNMQVRGSKSLLNSEPIQQIVFAEATAVAGRANGAMKPRSKSAGRFVADVQTGANRARAQVKAVGDYPSRHNAKHNTLLKALGDG